MGLRSGLPRGHYDTKHATKLHAMKKTLLAIILAYSSNQTLAQGPLAADTNQPVYSSNKAGNIAVGRNTYYYTTPRPINTIQKDNDHDSLRYAEFVTPLFKALQDLTAQLNAQHEEIQALKEQLTSFRGHLGTPADSTNYKNVALYQNYPTPPSTETEIKISLPKNTDNANLIFYTREGQQLKVLHLFNRGDFIVKVDSRDLGMGTCFYALMVDGKIIDSKRLLVRRKSYIQTDASIQRSKN